MSELKITKELMHEIARVFLSDTDDVFLDVNEYTIKLDFYLYPKYAGMTDYNQMKEILIERNFLIRRLFAEFPFFMQTLIDAAPADEKESFEVPF